MLAIKVPPLGESIVEATISRWLKKEGDTVAAGETLVELETDKITVEVPALKAGVLTRLLKKEGDTVAVDETLAELDEQASGAGAPQKGAPDKGAGDKAAPEKAAPEKSEATAATPKPEQAPAAASAATSTAASQGDWRASPAAQRAANERGVDLGAVSGTGMAGVISKPDVIEAADAPKAKATSVPSAPAASAQTGMAPAAPSGGNTARETREKMTTRRKRIAENLLQSQHATAHLTTFNEVDMSAVVALRERVREKVEKTHGVKLSFMPFFIRAATQALAEFPVVNASIDGDTIVYHHYVNMGIAVASPQGLTVPNIKDAHAKGMLAVSREMGAIATRARDGKLTMEDLTGGTFTITNGGVFGSLVSTPIINYPQVAILGLHKMQDRPMAIGGKVEIRPMMYVALSYDHRIIDGQQAVLFLVRVKELMEDPASMLIE